MTRRISESRHIPPLEGRERNRQAKRDRIIAAASELFAKHGIDDVTAQPIADKADIGTGTLFLYSKSKRRVASSRPERPIGSGPRARTGQRRNHSGCDGCDHGDRVPRFSDLTTRGRNSGSHRFRDHISQHVLEPEHCTECRRRRERHRTAGSRSLFSRRKQGSTLLIGATDGGDDRPATNATRREFLQRFSRRHRLAVLLKIRQLRSITRYTPCMKTAISVPNGDFERFERVAARFGMNRSEFFRVAAQRFADQLEGASELTAIANAVLARSGQPAGDGFFIRESERLITENIEW